jgi:hypothetical protein
MWRTVHGVPTEHLLQQDDPTLTIVIVSIAGGFAIVCAIVAGVVALTRIAVRHRERMARIGMGIDPDCEEPLSQLPSHGSSTPNAAAGAWDNRFTAPRSQAPRDA